MGGESPGGRRRARTLRGALLVTLLGAVVPGAGYVWAGRRLGYLLAAATVAAQVVLLVRVTDLDALVALAVDPSRLTLVAASVSVGLALWAFVVVTTYRMVRPVGMPRHRRVAGGVLVSALCLVVAVPTVQAVRYADTQADLVESVFEDNRTATVPRDVTPVDPWGGRRNVGVLLVGGDSGPNRDGTRTDTMALLDVDTRTGESVLFSLPRNMMNAQFPLDSPLHALYPEGFGGDGDPAAWMLNAVYGQVPILHPGVLGGSDNEGADALKQAVAGTLGTRVDYYVLVDLQGFPQLVDAIGGVTVNINEPVAIGGITDLGVPPQGWLEPGPDQHLDGFHAMWFARGRYGSDDYARMLRQRCLIDALIAEADPFNLLRRYQDLAAAGKQLVQTDIPQELLPAFVDLAQKVKQRKTRSVAFVASDRFFSGDPDFEWMQSVVDRALDPPVATAPAEEPEPADGGTTTEDTEAVDGVTESDESEADDPGAAVTVADTCGYVPNA
ncbi:LCP family protein [Nocardioides sp. GCM10027113]|uniref:LCP family protein n=1 Tax=unclassified Nocardioides TaxID=2615069 RepID=UPI00360A36D4